MNYWRDIREELEFLGATLREPVLWLLLLATIIAGAGAYRFPFDYTLDIGGSPDAGLYDRPYLLGFNDQPEYDAAERPRTAFRWAYEDARITLPGIGRTPRLVVLQVVAGQPGGNVVPVGLSLDERPLTAIPLAQPPRLYHLFLPADKQDLDLRLRTPPFQAAGDPRLLGFAVDALSVEALAPAVPAPVPLAWLGGCVAAGYVLLRRWGLSPAASTTIGLAAGLGLALLLAFERLGVTTFAPRLFLVLVAAYLLTGLLRPPLRVAAGALSISATPAEMRAVVALVALAWIIRLGALAHPQAYSSDLGLNVNNLRGVTRGEIIFTEGLPAEAGGGQAPYPPAQYLILLPFGLVFTAGPLIEGAASLADSLVIAAGWLLLRAAGASSAAGLFGAASYLFAMPLLISLSIGEMANVWGQALVAPLFLLLQRETNSLHEAPRLVLLGSVLAIALLGHFGVFLSLLLFLAVYVAALGASRRSWLQLAVVVGVALLLCVLIYYSAFGSLLLTRPAQEANAFGVGRISNELAWALAPAGSIGPLALLLGLAGLGLVMSRLRSLRPLFVAWWVSALLSLAPLLWTAQALRWQAFLFPALAWGAGVLLATLHGRGKTGKALAYGLLACVVLRGVVLWYSHIATYLH